MAESIYMGSGTAANDVSMPARQRPATAGSPTAAPTALMALSHPDRTSIEPAGGSWKAGSLKHPPSVAKVRPSSAFTEPRVTGMAAVQSDGVSSPQDAPPRIFGRMSLYDAIDINTEAHAFFGPKVLRNLAPNLHGFGQRGPDRFLKQGDGCSLKIRVALKELLKKNPVNRDPTFRKGTGGVHLSWETVPKAGSIFRHLYDNGTIDFVALRWTNRGNEVVWGRRDRPGLPIYWHAKPTEVEVARWLPIFIEGIREYEEPYRFLSIMGAMDLIDEAGPRLNGFAADLVQPLKKALDNREPTVVCIAIELMKAVLRTDPQVGLIWIQHVWLWAQNLNLFLSKAFSVDLGYMNAGQVSTLRTSINEFLNLLGQYGGEDVVPVFRRYLRVDPPVTDEAIRRHRQKTESKETHRPWKQYTLI